MNVSSCVYSYDPLDRLVSATSASEPPSQRFYQRQRLVTEISGATYTSLFQWADQLLGQRDNEHTQLLATDVQRSVLSADKQTHQGYSPYGRRTVFNGLSTLLGFNGEQPDPMTGHYLLGNGYRAYNPVLMRFNSPDSLSPFGKGGVNTYMYCLGDPVNRRDPSGHLTLGGLSKVLVAVAKFKGARTTASASRKGSLVSLNINKEKELVNNYSHLLNEELSLLGKNYLSKGNDPRRLISSSSDIVSQRVGELQKFVMSETGQMATAISGAKGRAGYVSHPAIADRLGSQRIISAGTLWSGSMGELVVTNQSGHYRPTMTDLAPAVKLLREMGFDPVELPFN